MVSLLSVSILGCSHASVKRDNEIWFIDAHELTLYRVVENDTEQIIPIPKNPDMQKFMCISSEEADEIIKSVVEGQR